MTKEEIKAEIKAELQADVKLEVKQEPKEATQDPVALTPQEIALKIMNARKVVSQDRAVCFITRI